MSASVYAQPLPRPRRRNPNQRTKEPPHPAALRAKLVESSRGLMKETAAEMRARGYADEARRRNVYTERRRASRERKEFKKQYEPDGVRALREVPVWLPDKDVEAIEKEREAKRLFYERDLLDIHGKVPDNYSEQFATDTITILVYKTGESNNVKEITQKYLRREPESAWGEFIHKIEMILGLQKVDQIKRQRDGTTVMRIASLKAGERYIVEPSQGDALLSTITWGHDASLQQLRNRPRAPSSSGYSMEGFSTGFHRVADDVTQAQRHLRKALRDAEEKGWEADPHDLEVIQEAFQEKNEPVVLPKAKTRAEVIRRMKLKEDRELAEKVVKEAMLYLEEFYRVKKERFQKCSDVNRTPSTYFAALDDVEAMNDEVSSEPMSRDLIRDLYRKCARYICNHTVDPSQALEMWELEAPSRLLRYLDPGKGSRLHNGPGVLGDDLQSLQYFLCLSANMAFHGGVCGNIPFECGGLVLACRLLHARCVELRLKTRDADDELRKTAPLANLAPRPPPYNYEALVVDDVPSSQVDECTMRIAKSSRKRTTEDDEPPSEIDLRRIHWWALCVCLNTLRGDRRDQALTYLLGPARLPEALLQTFTRWNQYHGMTVMLAWVLRELAKESEDIRERLRKMGFFTLVKVAQKRHSEVHATHRDLQLCVDLLRDDVRDPFRLQDKLAEAVGDLELPLLDADASAYREFALHPEKVGKQPLAKIQAAVRLSRAASAFGRKGRSPF